MSKFAEAEGCTFVKCEKCGTRKDTVSQFRENLNVILDMSVIANVQAFTERRITKKSSSKLDQY